MPLTVPLSFLTWNLAMLERSAGAPPDWTEEHTQAAVRDIVLDAAPDVVLFQELPGVVPYVETHDMIRANPMSHSGNLATLVDHGSMEPVPSHRTVDGFALLTTFPDHEVTVANVHLAPGSAGADDRLAQLAAVIEASPTDALVVAGDTNTRVDEEAAIAGLGLDGDRPPVATWNGRRNRFRRGGTEFNAYFTRFFTSGAVAVTDVTVNDRPYRTPDGVTFDLSDHYALRGTIDSPRLLVPIRDET